MTNSTNYACRGESIEADVDGYTITATIEHDEDASIDDDDTHNTDQRVTGCDHKQQEDLPNARKAYHDGRWFYCGIVLSVRRRGVEVTEHAASLWGIECNYPGSDNSYLTDVANELIEEAIETAKEYTLAILSALV